MAGGILVCTDGSELSEEAISHAFPLLRPGSEVVVATVVDPPDPTLVTGTGMAGGMMTPQQLDDIQQVRETEAREIVERTASRLATDAPVVTRVVVGDPGQALCALAREVQASVIVIGSRGRGGLKRALLGSISDYVVRNAGCPVIVARATEH
jgi:nucleotide-binding universal stress UspA family protein